jgi:hypothetical protein
MGVVPVVAGEFTAVRAPVVGSILNVEMLLGGESPPVSVLVTYRNVPEALTAIPKGLLAANGDPGTGVSAPLELLMLKTETLPLSFPTKTNLPAGSTATPWGVVPVENGEPGTGVRTPVLVLIEKAERLPAFWLLTNRNLWTESSAMNSAPAPDAKGEPVTVERPPDALTAKADTLPEPELATKAKLTVGPAGIIGLFPMFPPHPFTMSRRARMSAKTKDRMSDLAE